MDAGRAGHSSCSGRTHRRGGGSSESQSRAPGSPLLIGHAAVKAMSTAGVGRDGSNTASAEQQETSPTLPRPSTYGPEGNPWANRRPRPSHRHRGGSVCDTRAAVVRRRGRRDDERACGDRGPERLGWGRRVSCFKTLASRYSASVTLVSACHTPSVPVVTERAAASWLLGARSFQKRRCSMLMDAATGEGCRTGPSMPQRPWAFSSSSSNVIGEVALEHW